MYHDVFADRFDKIRTKPQIASKLLDFITDHKNKSVILWIRVTQYSAVFNMIKLKL